MKVFFTLRLSTNLNFDFLKKNNVEIYVYRNLVTNVLFFFIIIMHFNNNDEHKKINVLKNL